MRLLSINDPLKRIPDDWTTVSKGTLCDKVIDMLNQDESIHRYSIRTTRVRP
jgi:hypothetical protein